MTNRLKDGRGNFILAENKSVILAEDPMAQSFGNNYYLVQSKLRSGAIAGASAAFVDPNSYNPSAWFRTDSITTAAGTGGMAGNTIVTSWANKATGKSGNPATGVTTTGQIYRATDDGNYPTVYFNAGASGVLNFTTALNLADSGGGATLIAVIRQLANAFIIGDDTQDSVIVFDGTNWTINSEADYTQYGSLVDGSNFHVVAASVNGSSLTFRYDQSTITPSLGPSSTLEDHTTFKYIGMSNAIYTSFITPEIIIYPTALTVPQIQNIEAYLKARYNNGSTNPPWATL